MATVSKRIYVGGLYPGISETELKERFSKYGIIEKVDIKHKQQMNALELTVRFIDMCIQDESEHSADIVKWCRQQDSGFNPFSLFLIFEGLHEKTFAYLNFSSTEDQLQKCFSLFNKTKWKGHELKLQIAKENFIERLNEERQNNFEIPDKMVTKKSAVNKPLEGIAGVKDFTMTGAVPGTPVTEEKTWIVGKYGRVLPVVHIRSNDKRKMIKVDPSKFCHFVKKVKDSQVTKESDENMETLTWNIEENGSEMMKKRKGEFPKWHTQKRNKRSVDQTLLQQKDSKISSTPKHSEDLDFEVVSSHLDLSCQTRAYFSEESDEDTDYEAMFKQKQLSSDGTSRTVESIGGCSELEGIEDNQHAVKQEKTNESRLQPKDLLGQNNKSIVCSQNTEETKKSCKLSQCNKNDIIVDPDVSSDVTASPSERALELSPNTELKHAKPKLQRFRGIQQLYDKNINNANCHQSTEVQTKQNDNNSENSDNMFTQQHHLSKTRSPHVPSSSDSDSESASSADTDVVIASAKKLKVSDTLGVAMDTLHNTSIHNEYSDGLCEERTGFSSQDLQEDSDIEDDFEKLVKGAVQKQTSTKKPTIAFVAQKEVSLERASLNYKDKSFSSVPDKTTAIPSVIKVSKKKDLKYSSESDSGNVLNKTNEKAEKIQKTEKTKDKLNVSMQSEKGPVYADKTEPVKIIKQGQSQKICLSSELKTQAVQKSGKLPVSSSAKKMEKKIETNEKRLKSLEERKQENCVQKSLIKRALSSIDKSALPNKKIVFDSDDDDFQSQNVEEKNDVQDSAVSDDDTEREDISGSDSDTSSTENNDAEDNLKTEKTGNMEKKMLFDSSSEDDSGGSLADDEDDNEETFRLRPQFEGDKGQKLMELQMRFGNDERFKLDERFNEEQDDGADDRLEDKNAEEVDEKTRSLRVLQEVVGTAVKMPVDNKEKSKRLFRDMSSLQYDPDTEHHRDLELEDSSQQQPKKKKSKTKKGNLEENETEKREVEMPQVSKDRFYEVSETLTQVFRNKSEESQEASFSLLSAFGSQDRGDNQQENEEKDDDLTTSNPQGGILSWQRGGVLDSSEESDIEEDHSVPVPESSSSHAVVFSSKVKTFFFTEDDGRIAEGVANFCRHGDLEEIREKWLEKRPNLVESYRTKHKRLLRKARLMERKRIQNKKIQQRKEILRS